RAESSAPFLRFYRTFRRMAHFAIRHCVNQLQVDYQSKGTPPLPLLYASYASLKQWLAEGLRVDSADELLGLYEAETEAFWTRFRRLFERLFPLEWLILEETFRRTSERCASCREFSLPLSAEDIAGHFTEFLREVKAEEGYHNDREECRARFNELVAEANHLSSTA